MAVTQRVVNANGRKIRAKMFCTLLTAADADKIVTSVDMKNGTTYTIAAQPGFPSKITATVTAGDTADTPGTLTIAGTGFFGESISETITLIVGSAVSTTQYFRTVTSAIGAGWVIDAVEGTKDKITVGVPASGGIPAKGLRVSLYVVTGNLWWNDSAIAVADATAIPFIAGDSVEDLLISDTLSVISDGSGGTFYVIVWDE